MTDTAPPGSSEWWPGSDYDDVTKWWPQPAFTTQRSVTGVVQGGDYVRGSTTYGYPAYFIPGTTGAAIPDAADLTITGPVRITMKVQPATLTAVNSDQTFVAHWSLTTTNSWYLALRQNQGGLIFGGSFDGSAQNIFQTLASNAEVAAALPDGVDGWFGIQIEPQKGKLTALTSRDGTTWTPFGTPRTLSPFVLFDSNQSLRVASRGNAPWLGRIYWTQLDLLNPDGVASGLSWRFDPAEYPGTGSTYTDPRGRVWTTTGGIFSPAVVVGPNVQQSALRFPTTADLGIEEMVGTGIFYARPLNYASIELTWGITLDLSKWNALAIVRSAFGYPTTVNDGQTIFLASQAKLFPTGYTEMKDEDGKQPLEARKLIDPRDMPGVGMQVGLPNGRWYYYSLFFRSGTKWRKYLVTSAVLPRDYKHADHLFNNLPPYYQWMDDNMRGGAQDGDLRKFLRLIGYDLDLTREYVQGTLDLYHTDFTPVPLLRRLGANFGMPYEAGLGDIRHRGLISKIGFLYRSRGTTRGLSEMVVSVMKATTEITSSPNTMLLPDDSDFFEGTGSWAGVHPDTPLTSGFTPALGTVLAPSKVRLEHGVHVVRPPANAGRGVMRMWTSKADATSNVLITCGDGIAQDYDVGVPLDRSDDVFQGIRTLYPRYAGIPVVPKEIYSFSVQIKIDLAPVQVRLMIMWFSVEGDSQNFISASEPGPGPVNDTNWHTFTPAQGIAPANAAYAVPAVYFGSRLAGSDANYSPYIYLCAAQFSRIGTSATVTASSPDRYLTLTGPGEPPGQAGAEPIGPQTDVPPFEGYLIGDPTP